MPNRTEPGARSPAVPTLVDVAMEKLVLLFAGRAERSDTACKHQARDCGYHDGRNERFELKEPLYKCLEVPRHLGVPLLPLG